MKDHTKPKLKEMDYFSCLLFNEKPAVLVVKEGEAYVYCNDDKIDIGGVDRIPGRQVNIGNETTESFDPNVAQTKRGRLVIRTVDREDSAFYFVAFVHKGRRYNQKIIMLKVGICLPEEDQQHIG
jgi:hypothetical protein